MADLPTYNPIPIWRRPLIEQTELDWISYLSRIGQRHIIKGVTRYPKEQRLDFLEKMATMNHNYPGGLQQY